MLVSPEDHAAISDLYARYCLTLDHDEFEDWVALFTVDGKFEVYGRSFDGHDGLRSMAKAAPGGLHLGGPPAVDMIDETHARTRQNLYFVDRKSGDTRLTLYDDEIVRTPEGWRIVKRNCRFIGPDGIKNRPPRH